MSQKQEQKVVVVKETETRQDIPTERPAGTDETLQDTEELLENLDELLEENDDWEKEVFARHAQWDEEDFAHMPCGCL